MGDPNDQLRSALARINGGNLGERLPRQLRLVAWLKKRLPHSVVLHREAAYADRRSWQFNCHAFALGLNESEDYWRLIASRPEIAASARFVESVLTARQPIQAIQAAEGDLAVYQATGLVHTGVVAGQGIVSKWGMGHTWHHPPFEMPISYGTSVTYYRRLPLNEVVLAYVHHAAEPAVAADGGRALWHDARHRPPRLHRGR